MAKRKNVKRVDLRQLKFTTAEFGTVVRNTDGKVIGVFATDDEAYEAMKELSDDEREEP